MDNSTTDTVTWVEEYGDFLFRYAVARVRNVSTAEDLVQDTLLIGLQTVDTFSGAASARTWLTAILKHKIIDHYRHSSFIVEVGDAEDELFDDILHWREEAAPRNWNKRTPEGDLENKRLGMMLSHALAAIPTPLSTIFVLREIEGLCREEICELLGISDANYWVMLHRARLHLRREVEMRWQRDEIRGHESFGTLQPA